MHEFHVRNTLVRSKPSKMLRKMLEVNFVPSHLIPSSPSLDIVLQVVSIDMETNGGIVLTSQSLAIDGDIDFLAQLVIHFMTRAPFAVLSAFRCKKISFDVELSQGR